MARVQVMPDTLASQVAAGEVVERPASVVKELVENSIDAGAREVRLEIQRGGVAMVKVTDDGGGMDRENALLSLERHATSKLRERAELMTIRTLGFRGEALPSIASVARFRLVTREAQAVEGTEIVVEGGTLRDVRDAGCPPGTMVEVRDLFYNVPARRKFLRSESTEAAHIDHQVRLHALAAVGTRFVFRRDGRTVFDVAGSGDRRVRIGDLFGREYLDRLREVAPYGKPGMEISGCLLPGSEARKSRRGQYLFLNGRPVEDRVVWRALEEGYRGMLPSGRHPVAWLWLEMDPALVDVNVHPAKREVRFHRPGELRTLIVEAVERALREGRGPQDASGGFQSDSKGRSAEGADRGDRGSNPPGSVSPEGRPPVNPPESTPPRRWRAEAQPELRDGESAEGRTPAFRVVGAVQGKYLVLEAHDGMVLLEGEAARERILYEQLLRGAETGAPESQGLLVPVLVELEARDADVVVRNGRNFADAGMEVESFGGVTVQLRSLPVLLASADPKALLLDLVDEMVACREGRAGRTLAFERFAGELAKVGARGRPCRREAAQALLDELFACDLPYCTPDGRPTIVQISASEMARKFGR